MSSLNIFNRPVTGFNTTDLTLTCNSGVVPLTGASLTPADDTTWTLGGLAPLTAAAGSYTVQLSAAGSTIHDAAGHALTSGASVSWIKLGQANRLAFTVQPSTRTPAGQWISPGVIVQVQDQYGNLVSEDNTEPVNLSIASGPGTFTTSSITSLTVSGGIVTFASLALNVAGSYTLQASAGALDPVLSDLFIILPGQASQLSFAIQPSETPAGQIIDPETGVQVEVQDQYENRVTGDNATQVRLTISGPGNFTPDSTTTLTVSGGMASFTNLVLTTAAPGYTLWAGAPNLPQVTSADFTITPGQASKLAFKTQPTTTPAGQVINQGIGIQVLVEDWYGNPVTDDNTDHVSLTIAIGLGGFTPASTTSTTVSRGMATFSNLALGTAADYILRAGSGSLTPVTSNLFTISPCQASQLAFTTQPTSTVAGQFMTPPVVVQVRDAYGNQVDSDNTDQVSLVLTGGPGGFAAGSITSVTVSGGIGTFPNVALTTAANGYTLQATSGSLTPATSVRFDITPRPVQVSPAELPNWTVNQAGYSKTISATGGTGARTVVRSGTLPPGLTFNASTGLLSGKPIKTGTFNFSITATDSVGASSSRNYAVTINPAVTVSTMARPNWTVNQAGYSQSISVAGGTGAMALTISAGKLPTGLRFDVNTGLLSGTPTASGTFNFTITATDSVGARSSRTYAVKINAAVAVSPATLRSWTVNQASYSQTISASGGTGTLILSVSAGSPPPGLTFNAGTRILSGTPTTTGTFNFTITATDTVGASSSRNYAVTINPAVAVSPTPLSNWTVNQVGYSQTISATGGTGARTLVRSSGTLPPGLTFNASTGLLSGKPITTGTFNFTITATDSVGARSSCNYAVTINPAISISPVTLPNWTVNQAGYSQKLSASGGTGLVILTVSAGKWPTGLEFDPSTGLLSGIPTLTGTFNGSSGFAVGSV